MGSSIREIAELAGVSRGTVDRALNNRPGIRPEVQEHVLRIAKEQGYKPNRAARLLRSNMHPVKIGVIIPSEGNLFYESVIEGIKAAELELKAYGAQVILRTMKVKNLETEEMTNLIDELVGLGISCLAINPANNENVRDKINELVDNGIPVSTFNCDIADSKRLFCVCGDYIKSGRTAAGMLSLLSDGKPLKTAIITGYKGMTAHSQRVNGFVQEIEESGLTLQVVKVTENFDDEVISHSLTLSLLKEYPDIEAVFIAAGGVYGTCMAVEEMGLGHKIKMIAFDRTEKSIHYLKNGVLDAIITQEPYMQGFLPMIQLFDHLIEGKKHNEMCYTKEEIIIRQNL